MTKTALKEQYTEWNKAITKKEERQKEIFHTLQKLNQIYGDGHKWCSIYKNVKGLINKGYYSDSNVMDLMAEYFKIDGELGALKDLAVRTNNFAI